jgi:hypothetical protein
MKAQELIDILRSDPEAEVHAVTQPSYPMQAEFLGVVKEEGAANDDDECVDCMVQRSEHDTDEEACSLPNYESSVPTGFWLAIGGHFGYAVPREAHERAERGW